MINKSFSLLIALIALLVTINSSRAASLTYEVTHNWSTNAATFVPTVALPQIPRFNPALGTLTNVIYSLAGERRIDWVAGAPFQSGTYFIGAQVQFVLKAPELSGFPMPTLVDLVTPSVSASGFLSQGETAGGQLLSTTNGSGAITTELPRYMQTNQFFLLSINGLDGGSVGTGGGGTFTTLTRYASATVNITYDYIPVTPPTLAIVPSTPGNATISWAPNTPGFVLQETLSLSPANWTNSPSGATNPIEVPTTDAAKFYRLVAP